MDLIEVRLREISATIEKMKDHSPKTEEGTKNALVLPFIAALGYNIFDPSEVDPEYTADVGTKKGEKVDYAIRKGDNPIILIECKMARVNLDGEKPTQLYRYFNVCASKYDTRLAVLTNGINYRWYSDLNKPNVKDDTPFFEFSMEHVTAEIVEEIKRFAKENFDLKKILPRAAELKYTKGIKRELATEWANPSKKVVKLLAARVYTGNLTQAVLDQFTQLTRRAFQDLINERVNEQLEKAKVLMHDDNVDKETGKTAAELKAEIQKLTAQLNKLTGNGNDTGPKLPGKKVGVIASIVEFLKAASAKKPITLDEILAKLVERFPDRDSKGMKITVYAQCGGTGGELVKKKGLKVCGDKNGKWIEE